MPVMRRCSGHADAPPHSPHGSRRLPHRGSCSRDPRLVGPARRRLHAGCRLAGQPGRSRGRGALRRQRSSSRPGAAAPRRRSGPRRLGGVEGAPHGPVRLHGPRRPGATRRAVDGRAHGRLRRHGRLGGEHRLRLPDRDGGRRRLARLAGPPGEHRAIDVPDSRDRRGRAPGRHRLLGADVRHVGRRSAAASATASDAARPAGSGTDAPSGSRPSGSRPASTRSASTRSAVTRSASARSAGSAGAVAAGGRRGSAGRQPALRPAAPCSSRPALRREARDRRPRDGPLDHGRASEVRRPHRPHHPCRQARGLPRARRPLCVPHASLGGRPDGRGPGDGQRPRRDDAPLVRANGPLGRS